MNQQEPCHRYQKINGNFSVLGKLWKKLFVIHTGLACCKGKVLHVYIIIIIILLYCVCCWLHMHSFSLNRTWKGTRLAQIAFIYITLALLLSKREYVIITVQYERILAQCSVKPIIVDHIGTYIIICSKILDSELCSHVTAEFYRRFRIPIHISWNIFVLNVYLRVYHNIILLILYSHSKTYHFFTNNLITKNIRNWV